MPKKKSQTLGSAALTTSLCRSTVVAYSLSLTKYPPDQEVRICGGEHSSDKQEVRVRN